MPVAVKYGVLMKTKKFIGLILLEQENGNEF